jgi:hypothetical protein
MTQQEAKELSLEVWRYLRDHSKIRIKENLPKYLWERIKYLYDFCPLCDSLRSCTSCPLNDCGYCRSFDSWVDARNCIERQKAAAEIVRRIEAWEPEVEE